MSICASGRGLYGRPLVDTSTQSRTEVILMSIMGLLHNTFYRRKNSSYFNRSFSAYGKVNGKFMVTGVFRFFSR